MATRGLRVLLALPALLACVAALGWGAALHGGERIVLALNSQRFLPYSMASSCGMGRQYSPGEKL